MAYIISVSGFNSHGMLAVSGSEFNARKIARENEDYNEVPIINIDDKDEKRVPKDGDLILYWSDSNSLEFRHKHIIRYNVEVYGGQICKSRVGNLECIVLVNSGGICYNAIGEKFNISELLPMNAVGGIMSGLFSN